MHTEREIDALLSPGQAGSIIDRLMAMPRPAPGQTSANEWDRAVASRLEAHLARQMRALIGEAEERRSDAA
jgi:hypothetical protein